MADERVNKVVELFASSALLCRHADCSSREKPEEGVVAMMLGDVMLPFMLLSLAYALLFSAAQSNENEGEASQGA